MGTAGVSCDRLLRMTWIRHLLAVAVLPFTVTVVIPIWIARRFRTGFSFGGTPSDIGLQAAGLVVLAIGLTLFAASLGHFIVHGRGTLAPWDPPRKLVIVGPYRYVRNPMISGVVFILAGEALLLRSWVHLQWMLIFLVVNLIYIPLAEEPMLETRFGDDYREYKRRVPRIVPRVRPL